MAGRGGGFHYGSRYFVYTRILRQMRRRPVILASRATLSEYVQRRGQTPGLLVLTGDDLGGGQTRLAGMQLRLEENLPSSCDPANGRKYLDAGSTGSASGLLRRRCAGN